MAKKEKEVAALHNRFHKIVLPNALSFFGGSRFVPIISTIVYMFVGILMYFICHSGRQPLVEHISFAVSRIQNGEQISNPLTGDIHALFYKEF